MSTDGSLVLNRGEEASLLEYLANCHMTIATREDVNPQGNRWEEKVIWTGGDAFRIEVRSDNCEVYFDDELTLQELLEYMRKTAAPPFVWKILL
ncbi:hypothetical protein [Bradyrhizobium sp. WSM2793]|uniref:hypothetical protein n=1 Tax=Bradyrhizobium sp. WSM2793 TaxID=1038866 RepID=UPI0012F787BE|nr:hypothetical protein [Bradyrhizobium sp. WSM2793]